MKENQNPSDNNQAKCKCDLKQARIYYEMWAFRQSFCWTILRRFIIAGVAVSVIPYVLNKDLVAVLGNILLICPAVGGFVGIAGAWLYAAEYARAQPLLEKVKEILNEHKGFPYVQIPWILRFKIGWVTSGVLVIAWSALSVLNCFAVHKIILGHP